MKLIVNPHKIEIIKDELVNEKEIDISKCTFEFAEEITQEYVKEAYFTYNGETYKQIIINNECAFPNEVLEQKGMVEIGVVAYLVQNEQEIKRYNPSPAYFNTLQGSLKDAENSEPITPSEMEQFEQQLQNGLNSIDDKIDEVDTKMETVDTKIDEIDTAIEETNNLDLDVNKQDNKTTVTLTKKNGSTKSVDVLDGTDGQDGTSLEFMWQGTSLGIKTDDMQDYVFVDLQGIQGPVGETGAPFTIKKTYSSIAEMNADFDNMELGDYVMIASSVEIEDNAKLFTKGENAWIFITDFSGAMGIRGETGLTPNIQIGTVVTGETSSVTRTGTNENPILNFVLEKGEKGNTGSTGPQGETGNGIASVVKTSTSGLTDTYTITYTNGNTSTFNVTNGKGISSIAKTGTSGLVDTYTVTFNDNTTMTYTVTNGKDGEDGEVTTSQLNNAMNYLKTIMNALPKVEGEGTDITLDNTADSPLILGFKASESTQFTTTGKNKITFDNLSNISLLGVNTTYNNSEIQLNGTSTGTGQVIPLGSNLNIPITAGTYTISYTVKSGSYNLVGGDIALYLRDNSDTSIATRTLAQLNQSTTSISFTLEEDTILHYSAYCNQSNIKLDNLILEVQLEEGTTATEYEPYTNGASPNPDYPQDIQVIKGDNEDVINNKNLFELGTTNDYIGDGLNTLAIENNTLKATITRGSGTYAIKKDKFYGNSFYISGDYNYSSKRFLVRPFDSNNNIITNITVSGWTYNSYYNAYYTDTNSNFNLSSASYINFGVVYTGTAGNIGIYSNLMVTKSTNHTYVEHKEQNYPLNLGGAINLIDYKTLNYVTGNLQDTGVIETYNTNYKTSDFILLNDLGLSTGDTFTFQIKNTFASGSNTTRRLLIYDNNNNVISSTSFTSQTQNEIVSNTFTITNNMYKIRFGLRISDTDVQLEKGSTAHSYTPYGEIPIEMCKIGDYADEIFKNVPECEYYDSNLEYGKWYKLMYVRHITKNIIDMDNNEDYPGWRNVEYINDDYSGAGAINQFVGSNWKSNISKSNWFIAKNGTTLYFATSKKQSAWKTDYPDLVFELYYGLQNPTKTLLSDTLQTQLDNISYAMAYQDQTNISQVNEDRPFVISASTIKDMKTLEDRITALEESISL